MMASDQSSDTQPAQVDGDWSGWIGRTETAVEVLAGEPMARLAATLGRYAGPPNSIPPLGHWCYFLAAVPQVGLGPDGHPIRGGFLPPVSLPRRMWAGGQLQWHSDLHIGDRVTKVSTIEQVRTVSGRSGPLVFVTVANEFSVDGALALREMHDIVYRDTQSRSASAGAVARPRSVPVAARPMWERTVEADSTLLFRFSALTFNAHRIHYDRPYAQQVEGYPGLVVHGPLLATMLLRLASDETGRAIRSFSFRAIQPVFDGAPFRLCGRQDADVVTLELRNHDGDECMTATAELR